MWGCGSKNRNVALDTVWTRPQTAIWRHIRLKKNVHNMEKVVLSESESKVCHCNKIRAYRSIRMSTANETLEDVRRFDVMVF